jgi:hypothetical protein
LTDGEEPTISSPDGVTHLKQSRQIRVVPDTAPPDHVSSWSIMDH